MAEVEVIPEDFWHSGEPVVLAPPHLEEQGRALEEALRAEPVVPRAVVFATSGTTGAPKWIVHTRESLLASARMVNAHLDVSRDDRWLLALPVFHVGGFGIIARARETQVPGDVLEGKWDAGRFVESLEAGGATLTSLVPTQVADLVEGGLRAPGSLRVVLVGGGRLPVPLGRRARELGWPVLATYGMTEAGSQIATAPLAALEREYETGPLQILSGWKVQVDASGRLAISGAPLCRGVATMERGEVVFEPHEVGASWTTNDLGEVSGDLLTISGRADRMVKVRGELVDLDALEQSIHESHEGDGFLCLLGIRDDRIGRRLVPVFAQDARARAGEIVGEANRSLPRYVQLEPPAFVESLPKTPLGKVDYRTMTEMLEKSGR